MIELKKLNDLGSILFKNWLDEKNDGAPPAELMSDEKFLESAFDVSVDPDVIFPTQYEFGEYINSVLTGMDFNVLMSPVNDGMWNWLSVVYFNQLAPNKRKMFWCYIVARKGAVGSLAYRHVLRTSYELFHIHGENSKICLSKPLHIWSDIEESLASRQTIAHNRGFFKTAALLYITNGNLKRGAASKPKKKKLRKPGDKTGYGSVRRLAIALQRLHLTYDTEIMDSAEISNVLPREFNKWRTQTDLFTEG